MEVEQLEGSEHCFCDDETVCIFSKSPPMVVHKIIDRAHPKYSFGYPTHPEDRSEHSANRSLCGKGLGWGFLIVAEMMALEFLCISTRFQSYAGRPLLQTGQTGLCQLLWTGSFRLTLDCFVTLPSHALITRPHVHAHNHTTHTNNTHKHIICSLDVVFP